MADKKTLTGRVVDTVGDEFTTVKVTQPGTDAKPYFITDNNTTVQKTLLAVLKDHAFALEVTSGGPRGFMATLTIASRPAPGAEIEQMTVAATHNFDPATLDTKGPLTIDRWANNGRALVAGSQDAAARDGAFVDAPTRTILSLQVKPLLTVEAGGIEWRDNGPLSTPADFARVSALMTRYAPGQILKGVAAADLPKIVAATAALAETDELFDVTWDANQPAAPSPFTSQLSNLESDEGPTGRYGYLVHGSALPVIAGSIPIQATAVGGQSIFEFCLFACPTINDLNGFRSKIKPAT
jgi:hypothetical protein